MTLHRQASSRYSWVDRLSDPKAKKARKRGDEARTRGDWVEAAVQYRLHLQAQPDNFGIWVQLGHALKESGEHEDALSAYGAALSLNPNDSDLLLNLGHLHKIMGHRYTAITLYRRSLAQDGNQSAANELSGLGVTAVTGSAPPTSAAPVVAVVEAPEPNITHNAFPVSPPSADTPADANAPPSSATLECWLRMSAAGAATAWRPTHSRELLRLYLRELGLSVQAADTWAELLHADRAHAGQSESFIIVASNLAHNGYFHHVIDRIQSCSEFDARFYCTQVCMEPNAFHAAAHYLLIGEPLGLPPSASFDPEYYSKRNFDVVLGGQNCLLHYSSHGRLEGRDALPLRVSGRANLELFRPEKENIILFVHEASRTGAPILGWNIALRLAKKYNIYTVRLGDGPLTAEFEALSVETHGPFISQRRHAVDLDYGLPSLFTNRAFKFAIINSVECRPAVEVCSRRDVPTVLLVHEFSSYVRPINALARAYELATDVVFSAPIVARSAIQECPLLEKRPYHILPQGMSVIPSGQTKQEPPNSVQMQALAQAKQDGAFVVIGLGSVNLRKGVDLFISVAAAMKRLNLSRRVYFLWVGAGFRPEYDMNYSLFLKEQISRSGLEDNFMFMDEVSDLEPLYEQADAFLLSSRLDPLPNVAIDAAFRGVPTVCFENASGTADLLLADPHTALGVVPYLDVDAAANAIATLARDDDLLGKVRTATRRFAEATFDMGRYVARLDEIGSNGAAQMARRSEAVRRRRATPSIWFDPAWYAERHGDPSKYTFDHFLSHASEPGFLPSALVETIMGRFAPDQAFSLTIYDALVDATDTWPDGISRESIAMLVSLYIPRWHQTDSSSIKEFISYLHNGVMGDVRPGPLFDPVIYRERARAMNLPPLEKAGGALLHWLRHGAPARIVPTDRFDEAFYRKTNPDIEFLPTWGFGHFIKHGVYEGRRPVDRPTFYGADLIKTPGLEGMPEPYQHWYALDFPDRTSGRTNNIPAKYERRLEELVSSEQLESIFSIARSIDPEIGVLSSIMEFLLPPYHQDKVDGLPSIHAELRSRILKTHYDTVVCVPWIRNGGADLVAALLSRALVRVRPAERVLLLRTDNPHFERADWIPDEIDCVDISDLTARLTPTIAEDLLRIVFRGLTARRVFNVNSRLCWTTMANHGPNLAATLRTYTYMFCWDETPSGGRVGYPAEFFAQTADSVTAFLTDTSYLRTELTKMYRLPEKVQNKIIPLHTPAQSPIVQPSIARRVKEKSDAASRRTVFWAGRLDRQKRFGLVQEIAALMPDVKFRCWGEALLDAPPDLSSLPPNVTMEGSFKAFDDLPLTDVGAWLFTSLWEGMPTTIIELATRGVPVVASAVGGVPELIQQDTGWPVPPNATAREYVKALRNALSSPDEAVRRAEKLQQRVGQIYTEAMYDRALNKLLTAEDSE